MVCLLDWVYYLGIMIATKNLVRLTLATFMDQTKHVLIDLAVLKVMMYRVVLIKLIYLD